ncbi:hypothetical protein B9128_18615 [Shigella sonnei]|nr:hypothetical protein B9127_02800 [Shigella sonnei]ASN33498.1 hypothetical protein B9129_02160 [Shigella sonnei]ASN44112.1 hypothetical protein B9128_18615 [Shigella sonnei]OUZ65743.1 hypothetical protein CBL19_14860 [Shigella sonnei]OUZ93075.1 hypothetical protein CBL17_14045 [Shigella sonnei]
MHSTSFTGFISNKIISTFLGNVLPMQTQSGYHLPINDGNDSNLLIVFYVQIMPDDFVMQLHRF